MCRWALFLPLPLFILYRMIRFSLMLPLFLLLIQGVPGVESGHQVSTKERFSCYLAGIEYLQAADGLSAEEKADYYKKLVEITGFNAQTAQEYMKKYRHEPERWQKVIESVMEIINTPTEKKE